MYNFLKITFCFSVLFFFFQACSSQKSTSSSEDSMEATQGASKKDEAKAEQDDFNEEVEVIKEAEESSELAHSRPLQLITIPEQKFTIERDEYFKSEVTESNSVSESEQLSVSNKHAKVLLFAKKLQKGSYPIAKNTLPYATVHVMLTQGQEKIEGDLENGTVNLLLLDSAGITKGSFEGTLIKGNERYFIGGNFSN